MPSVVKVERHCMGIMREIKVTRSCGHVTSWAHVHPIYGGPNYTAADLPCECMKQRA